MKNNSRGTLKIEAESESCGPEMLAERTPGWPPVGATVQVAGRGGGGLDTQFRTKLHLEDSSKSSSQGKGTGPVKPMKGVGMKTILALWAILFVGLPTAEAQPQTGGPDGQIVLDEAEFVIMEGDRIKESKPMRARDADDRARELRKKGLLPNQRIATKRLDHPRLRFVDRKGMVTKELILGTEVHESSVSAASRPGIEKVRSWMTRGAVVSKSGKYAILIETRGEVEFRKVPSEGDGYRGDTSHLTFLDGLGNAVWEKKFPEGHIVATCKLSDDGTRIFCFESWTNVGPVPQYSPPLVVRNLTGTEIFKFPSSPEAGYHLWMGTSDIEISPNGKYVGIRARKAKREMIVFLDIEKGSHWDFDVAAAPVDITNDGVARLVHLSHGAKIETLNLVGKL